MLVEATEHQGQPGEQRATRWEQEPARMDHGGIDAAIGDTPGSAIDSTGTDEGG